LSLRKDEDLRFATIKGSDAVGKPVINELNQKMTLDDIQALDKNTVIKSKSGLYSFTVGS